MTCKKLSHVAFRSCQSMNKSKVFNTRLTWKESHHQRQDCKVNLLKRLRQLTSFFLCFLFFFFARKLKTRFFFFWIIKLMKTYFAISNELIKKKVSKPVAQAINCNVSFALLGSGWSNCASVTPHVPHWRSRSSLVISHQHKIIINTSLLTNLII
jgi:hypothetical protein